MNIYKLGYAGGGGGGANAPPCPIERTPMVARTIHDQNHDIHEDHVTVKM